MPISEDKFTENSMELFTRKLVEEKYISLESEISAYEWAYDEDEDYWEDSSVQMDSELPENIRNLMNKLPELNPKLISFNFENYELFKTIEENTVAFCKDNGFDTIPYIHKSFSIGLSTPECEEGGSIRGIEFSMDGWFVFDMVEKGYIDALLSVDELTKFLKIAGSFFSSEVTLDCKS